MNSNNLKIGDIVELDVYMEICCDVCNDIIHNHIDCPVCKMVYAPMNIYGEMYDVNAVECESCGSIFTKRSNSWYSECQVVVSKISEIE